MSDRQAFCASMQQGVYKAIFERRDMRHFNGEPVAEEIMQRLFRAAHAAPSVGLMQPWRFIRVKNSALKAQLHQLVQQETQLTAAQMGEKNQRFLALKVQAFWTVRKW